MYVYEHQYYAFHELVFGTVLANLLLVLSILRFVWKYYSKFKEKVELMLKQHQTLWDERAARFELRPKFEHKDYRRTILAPPAEKLPESFPRRNYEDGLENGEQD